MVGADSICFWIWNQLRFGEPHEPAIALDQVVRLLRGEPFRVEHKVCFDLLLHHLGQKQAADARGAKRKHRFIESPWGNQATCENICVKK